MAEYDYAGDPSIFPTPKANTNGSGTATFWEASWKKLVDRTAYLNDQLLGGTNGLGKQTASSGDTLVGVLTYAGAFLTLPTGTLREVLQYIANNAANGVSLASQAVGSFGTALIGQRAITDANQGNLAAGPLSTVIALLWQGKAGLGAANTYTGARIRSGAGATDAERATRLLASDTAYTFATSNDLIWVDMADGTTPNNQISTASTAGAAAGVQTVHLAAYNTTIGEHVTVKRQDGSTICILGGAGTGFATLKLLTTTAHPTGRWRLTAASGDVTITTPY